MRKLNLLLATCCVIVVTTMCAQADTSPDVPEIQGVVTRAGSGEKLAGVEIKFAGIRGGKVVQIGSTISRDDGTYYLRDSAFLGQKSIVVTATMGGYADWSRTINLDESPLTIDIELTPATE